MKGGGGGGGGGGKRRWRGLVIGVMVLVVLSMLVPLAFLLGLHNGFHSPGFITVQTTSASIDPTTHTDQLVQRLAPTFPNLKNVHRNSGSEAKRETIAGDTLRKAPPPKATVHFASSANKTGAVAAVKSIEHRTVNTDETGKSCELRYGSYCLWRGEKREEMKDSKVKKMKDQLFVARAYYPSIAKMPSQDKLTRELKQNIQDFERILSESTTDADLPAQVDKKLEKMETVISRSKTFPVDCNNVDKKLRQILDMTEDEANFHMKQSVFLYQLAVQTMPKSLHCLSMRLTMEFFKSDLVDMELSAAERFSDPSMQHYVIISNNVLASSVVINSTVLHARESRNLVFHVLTDEQNYFGMKLWFFRNTYKEAAVQVLNIERLNLNNHNKATLSYLSLPVEFRVSFHSGDNRTHYLSVFSHSHYLLPGIFQNLNKVVVLDDDVVVQRDLSVLWDLDMKGKVNGAAKYCSVKMGQLKSFIAGGSFDPNSCSWMSGLNIIDLARWRELDLSETYWKLVKEQMSRREISLEAVALLASLLTFQDRVYALDDGWVLSGLGYDYSVSGKAIKNALVLHYNGKMKPWLELGIPKYKVYWKKSLTHEDQFMSDCNVNP